MYEYNNSCGYFYVIIHLFYVITPVKEQKLLTFFALLMKPFGERTFDSILECVSLAVKLHKENKNIN